MAIEPQINQGEGTPPTTPTEEPKAGVLDKIKSAVTGKTEEEILAEKADKEAEKAAKEAEAKEKAEKEARERIEERKANKGKTDFVKCSMRHPTLKKGTVNATVHLAFEEGRPTSRERELHITNGIVQFPLDIVGEALRTQLAKEGWIDESAPEPGIKEEKKPTEKPIKLWKFRHKDASEKNPVNGSVSFYVLNTEEQGSVEFKDNIAIVTNERHAKTLIEDGWYLEAVEREK